MRTYIIAPAAEKKKRKWRQRFAGCCAACSEKTNNDTRDESRDGCSGCSVVVGGLRLAACGGVAFPSSSFASSSSSDHHRFYLLSVAGVAAQQQDRERSAVVPIILQQLLLGSTMVESAMSLSLLFIVELMLRRCCRNPCPALVGGPGGDDGANRANPPRIRSEITEGTTKSKSVHTDTCRPQRHAVRY